MIKIFLKWRDEELISCNRFVLLHDSTSFVPASDNQAIFRSEGISGRWYKFGCDAFVDGGIVHELQK